LFPSEALSDGRLRLLDLLPPPGGKMAEDGPAVTPLSNEEAKRDIVMLISV
jgi:hypothetical protein